MKILNQNWPVDIVIFILWSVILVPISLLNIEGYIRIILGLPFVLFIPGYILIYALFPPQKISQRLSTIERISLSFGFSIALIPLLCLVLNYTPWGIRLESILFSILIFNVSIGFVVMYRWIKINPDERIKIALPLSFLKSKNKLDYSLNIVIIISLIIAVALPINIILTPKTGEKFTEFYFFNLANNPERYSRNLTMGVSSSRIVEIVNHEYETINYTVELWLLNYTEIYNEPLNEIEYILSNMWFIDKNYSSLSYSDLNVGTEEELQPQNDITFDFTINRTGTFRLTFLLYKTTTNKYIKDMDYIALGEEKISSAHREIHQWIDVYYHIPPIANFTVSPDELSYTKTIYFTSNSVSSDSRIIKCEWNFGDENTSSGYISGLEFGGINDYIDCGTNPNLQPVIGTIEAWIYPKELLENGHIFTTSGNYSFRHPCFLLSGNELMLILTNNTAQDPHTYLANFKIYTWYHVAVTWDGSNVFFYINGVLREIQIQNLIPAGNMAPKRIGTMTPPNWPEAFNGFIRDVRIYNRSLASTEIQNNYDNTRNPTLNGLVSWWKMNDTGNIAYDSIRHNNGIIYGTNKVYQASHKYSHSGSYQVKLTITNEFGQIDSFMKNILIT